MSETDLAFVDQNIDGLEIFVMKYLLDNGIGVHLVEAVAKELFGQAIAASIVVSEEHSSNAKDLVSTAINDVVEVNPWTGAKYSLERVLEGAASLDFLVRYAHKVDPAVFPPEIIPSDELVSAALRIFHKSRQAVSS